MNWIAFLRAINVGGHNVKMEELRALFEGMGFSDVATYIASGNVIFSSGIKDAAKLEATIEKGLEKALGYEVVTFVRTPQQIADAAEKIPFPADEIDNAKALNVAFLKAPLTDEQQAALKQFETEIDSFATRGSELYWKCLTRQSDSKFNNNRLERALKLNATFRGINTVRKLTAKYGM
ncbi:DUF1697 domain-containing protein [bacterium]|nr:DUF1697 domain-containing protein [bacterium]